MVSIREWNRSHRKQEAYTKPQGMTNDGLLFKLHAIESNRFGRSVRSIQGDATLMDHRGDDRGRGSDTKTDALYVEF